MSNASALVGICLLASNGVAQAQSPALRHDNGQRTAIDRIVHRHAPAYMRREGTIGLSLGLVLGEQTRRYNYGEVEKGRGERPTADTLYCFGSVGKSFVGVLLAQAMLDRLIGLEDDVRKHIPDGLRLTHLEYRGRPIRIAHLATHTSGIPNSIIPSPDNWATSGPDEKALFKRSQDEKTFLAFLQDVTIDAPPGDKYAYSGAGIRLLSIILGQVYGKPYVDLFRAFTDRQGMRRTKIVAEAKDWETFAVGDQDRGQLARTRSDLDDVTGAPGGLSTVDDMIRYLRANLAESDPAVRVSHLRRWEGSGRRLGLVWRLDAGSLETKRVFHSGRGLRNQCYLLMYPHKDAGIVVFTNDVLADTHVEELANGILNEIVQRARGDDDQRRSPS